MHFDFTTAKGLKITPKDVKKEIKLSNEQTLDKRAQKKT